MTLREISKDVLNCKTNNKIQLLYISKHRTTIHYYGMFGITNGISLSHDQIMVIIKTGFTQQLLYYTHRSEISLFDWSSLFYIGTLYGKIKNYSSYTQGWSILELYIKRSFHWCHEWFYLFISSLQEFRTFNASWGRVRCLRSVWCMRRMSSMRCVRHGYRGTPGRPRMFQFRAHRTPHLKHVERRFDGFLAIPARLQIIYLCHLH